MTAIDTSTNYLGFLSHETLARTAGDLLPSFTVSTKVGYFPSPGRAEHSLAPSRLRAAVEDAVRDLGREPDVVFLHNPEHSLRGDACRDREVLAHACAALSDTTAKGLCGAWGIATWNPSPLLGLIDGTGPRPSVLMVRAGLLVGARTLDAADRLSEIWDLDHDKMWGMSPFGGSASAPLWEKVDPRIFLRDGEVLSHVQAAFRAAYLLPRVGAVAVGSDEPAHLGELIEALACAADERVINEYRRLLRDRLHGQAS